MRPIGFVKRHCAEQGRTPGALISLLGLISFLFLLVFSSTPLAKIPMDSEDNLSLYHDPDNDVLPIEFEELFGTDPMDPDSDDDGFIDSIEYVLHTDPLDQKDLPVLEPGMRVAAYQVDNIVKLCMVFFPGDPKHLDSFRFYVAFDSNVSPGTTVGRLELTSIIPLVIKDANFTIFNGHLVSAYIVDFPVDLIKKYYPISIGIISKIIDMHIYDIIDLDYIDGLPVRLMPGDEVGFGDDSYYFSILSGDPPPSGWSDEEVCETQMKPLSNEDGVIKYEITDAECTDLVRQLCSPSKCAEQIGTEIISIDPGFLIGHSD